MEKTTVYLTPDQKQALTDAARAEGRSEARLIRDGIDGVIARHRISDPTSTYGTLAPAAIPKPIWLPRDEFTRRFAGVQADAGLTSQLHALAPDSTAELESTGCDL